MIGTESASLVTAVVACSALFIAMLGFLEIGRALGARRLARDPERAEAGTGAVDGAVFALLGLLVAFTFSGAASRFDDRRHLVIEEANAVGTAWLRIDTLPENARPGLRDLFRRYLDARIEAYRKLPDIRAARAELARSAALQGDIWNYAVSATREASGTPPAMLLLPALNEMFDITTTRTAATQIHPPTLIFLMLGAVSLMAALLAGHGMAGASSRSWVHMLVFALVISATVYVIVDMEYPRLGIIRVDAIDQLLVDLRRSFD
jgi:hypothetical protein